MSVSSLRAQPTNRSGGQRASRLGAVFCLVCACATETDKPLQVNDAAGAGPPGSADLGSDSPLAPAAPDGTSSGVAVSPASATASPATTNCASAPTAKPSGSMGEASPDVGGMSSSGGGADASSSGAPQVVTAEPVAGAGGGAVTERDSGGPAGLEDTAAAAQAALDALVIHLAAPRADRAPLLEQPFAGVPLGKAHAERARELLWEDHRAFVADTRREEFDAKVVTRGELSLRYDYTVFGDKPATGRSLYLSLHGGGNADPSVNDEQWENQKALYQPDEGVYLSPRAPTDTWNLWHEAHIDPMFQRLISDLIVFEDVNPDRVYVMGYSAGGDGVYQLGPRMADHWAAASAMAGHPNEAQPLSLRNIGFTVHVGAQDADYERNQVAQQWGERMDELEAADPGGYVHVVQLHEGKGHWMDLEDAVAVPWMAEFTREPAPSKIVWLQDDITHSRFYWLAVPDGAAVKDALITASVEGQRLDVSVDGTDALSVRLSDDLVDLDLPVKIVVAGVELHDGAIPRTIGTLWTTLEERGDPRMVFDAEMTFEL
jgi:hypothetical protein